MQAFCYSGGEVSESNAEPIPELGPRDLLVKVSAAGLNPVDVKVVTGGFPAGTRNSGYDGVGVVEAVGSEVKLFKVGDKVYGAGSVVRNGSFADKWAVDERVVAKPPSNLEDKESASIALVALTAWEGLFEKLGINIDDPASNQGKTLLVLPGAGGTGSYIIQLAKIAGLTVIATGSRPESREAAKGLGACHTINHSEDLKPQLEALGIPQVDYIFNAFKTTVYWDQYATIIKPFGSIVSIVEIKEPLDMMKLFKLSVTFSWELMFTKTMFGHNLESQGEILKRVAGYIEGGQLKVPAVESQSWSLENYKDILAKQTSGKTIGKLTLFK